MCLSIHDLYIYDLYIEGSYLMRPKDARDGLSKEIAKQKHSLQSIRDRLQLKIDADKVRAQVPVEVSRSGGLKA